jgi:hypothetical protein
MMLFVYNRSKRKKPTAKKLAEYQAWLDKINSMPMPSGSKKVLKINLSSNAIPKLKPPAGRETPRYPSLSTAGGMATKPNTGKVYTGTAMLGIGTLHKSNAVPIFSVEDAKDQANMRR